MVEMDISKFSSAVLEEVHRTGEAVRIMRSGEPLAEIVPAKAPEGPKRWLGSMQGTGKILGDIISPALEEEAWDVLRP
jgi:antitoxin (DNA-binding transcriptional repressor) of toxin-antitoxin stability system